MIPKPRRATEGRPSGFVHFGPASGVRGLEPDQAADRLQQDGPNELPAERGRSLIALLVGVVREPMLLLLVGAAVLYFVLGDLGEAVTLAIFVFVIIGITVVQERKTVRALEALRDMSAPRALVIRGGTQMRIPGREVVVGDVLVLTEGDRIPADGVVIDCTSLQVDESLLTGESVPVRKRPWDGRITPSDPGGDDRPFIYSGTLVARGYGLAEARATGAGTAMGRIGRSLAELPSGPTPLQRQVGKMVRVVGVTAIVLCGVLITTHWLLRGGLVEAMLAGIALAMAIVPEEFPVVLTVFLAVGAWRLSRNRVLTRRIPTVETLGSATVLCVDKTGTLTENRMRIAALVVDGHGLDVTDAGNALPERFHPVIEYGILASQRDPFDPMEVAFYTVGNAALAGTEHLHGDWVLEREYPLSATLLAMSHVWRAPDAPTRVIAAKGAPEAIFDLCHLDQREIARLENEVRMLAARGLRILAVARGVFDDGALPGHQHAFAFELVGLVGLHDPVRHGVPEAVEHCRTAGIRIVMITGDYPETARAIGDQLGFAGDVVTGGELMALSESELRDRLRTVSIIARATPDHKLRIVTALRECGEVVAMTGDGINDAPALRASDIGVAMGRRGTDVAREAADLVVTDDDFASIVAAVRIGRRIYDNLRKSMAYILAVHVPIAGAALLPVLFGWPLLLMPIHIVFLELVIDPACSIAFEAEPAESDVMCRPPRRPQESLFGPKLIGFAVLQGVSVLVAIMAVSWSALSAGASGDAARTLAFSTILAGNLGLILVNRSWSRPLSVTMRRRNGALWAVVVGAGVVLALALGTGPGRELLGFAAVEGRALALALAAGPVSVAWFELMKVLRPLWKTSRARDNGVSAV